MLTFEPHQSILWGVAKFYPAKLNAVTLFSILYYILLQYVEVILLTFFPLRRSYYGVQLIFNLS